MRFINASVFAAALCEKVPSNIMSSCILSVVRSFPLAERAALSARSRTARVCLGRAERSTKPAAAFEAAFEASLRFLFEASVPAVPRGGFQ